MTQHVAADGFDREIDDLNRRIRELENVRKTVEKKKAEAARSDKERTQKFKEQIQTRINELCKLVKDSGFDHHIKIAICSSPNALAENHGWPDIGAEGYKSEWVSSWC